MLTVYLLVARHLSHAIDTAVHLCRYQFFLQIKQDIQLSRLAITNELAAQLLAFIIQCNLNVYQLMLLQRPLQSHSLLVAAELGDYDSRTHQLGYVSEFRLTANQSSELEHTVCELHKKLMWVIFSLCLPPFRGQSPMAIDICLCPLVDRYLPRWNCNFSNESNGSTYTAANCIQSLWVLRHQFRLF